MTKHERSLRCFETLQIALAIDDAKRMHTTPDIERRADALYTAGRRKIASIRYAENARWPVMIGSNAIRPTILMMNRADVLVGMANLRAAHPQLQFAHRDCETLSDHDLRAMLEDAMRLTESKE